MEKAKAAVSGFVSRSGRHDTTVDERQAPAIKHEEVTPTRHENITTAVDREVHQDHHHTTIQPIKDREVLPEKHSHQTASVQHKEFEHANPQEVKARLDSEAAQFRDTSTTHSTQQTQAVAPTVEGERVHHHVHETVQPVIEKQVIAPSVVHTTVPIHETHHAAPEHHGTSVLPTKTLADFKSSGHGLTGSTGIINQDQYDGCPRPYNSELQIGRTEADSDHHHHTPGIGGSHGSSTGPHNSNLLNKADPRVDSDRDGRGIGTGTHHNTAGPHSSDVANKADPRVDSDRDGRGIGTGTGTGSGIGGQHNTGAGIGGQHNTSGPHSSGVASKLDPRVDSDRDGRGIGTGGQHGTGTHTTPYSGDHTTAHASGHGDTSGHKKPSLIDRLNPLKDSDGDGQKGFLK